MTVNKGSVLGLLVAVLILAVSFVVAGDMNVYPVTDDGVDQPAYQPDAGLTGKGYLGRLKVYMVEPDSRWETYTPGTYYHNGFLDFAFDTTFDLSTLGGSMDRTIIWDAAVPGYGDVTPNNLKTMVVLTNLSQSYPASSDTIGGHAHPFDAYYHDACAVATIDEQWPNVSNEDFTHSVFLEEGTATWCPSCPGLVGQLSYAHDYYTDYPFFYAAMVVDEEPTAATYMDAMFDHNWLPTTYYDGGDTVWVGSTAWFNIGGMVQQVGRRDVQKFGLTVEMTHLSGTRYEIHFSLSENAAPEQPAAPTGNAAAVVDADCGFTASSTDPDGNDMFYRFDYGDGDTSAWYGPQASGVECAGNHTFTASGDYEVKVQAKDTWGFESSWSAGLAVTIYAYLAGDPNGDLLINILDCTFLINYLYKSGPAPDPLDAGDVSGDGSNNILDVTYLINYLYKGGPAPVYP